MSSDNLDIVKALVKLEKQTIELDKSICKYNDKEIKRLQQRIDKAIEHLHKRNEQNKSALTNKEQTIISKHELLKLEIINNEILENILRGKE